MARGDHHDLGSSRAPAGAPAQMPAPGGFNLEDLKIDRDGEIPIGVQLAWALRARIGDGRLIPGQRLPGLRELGEMLGINANTARAVYQRLEQEGLIDSRQGTGTFVASVAQEPSAVGQIAADAAHQARKTGVDPRDVAAALYVTAEPSADVGGEAAQRRRELRAQIAALEQTLAEIQARHPGLIAAPLKPLRHAGPRLLGVEELERVRMELVRRLATVEPLLDTPAEETQAVARARRATTRTARSGGQAADAKQVKPSEPKKATRPRPSTNPSTA